MVYCTRGKQLHNAGALTLHQEAMHRDLSFSISFLDIHNTHKLTDYCTFQKVYSLSDKDRDRVLTQVVRIFAILAAYSIINLVS